MSKETGIAWTDHTFNPWWGCTRVSPGCEHCYAETFAKRVGQKVWGVEAERRFFGEKHWQEPCAWNRAAAKDGVRRRVFCASMADVFEDRPELESSRGRLFGLIEATPMLDWQLLTKRPENILAMLPSDWLTHPRENVWLGTTTEDQKRTDERLPVLLSIPAAVRFISAEPLLGGIDIAKHRPGALGLHWCIIGGESGNGARACELWWIRNLIGQCRNADVNVFVKQLGANPKDSAEYIGTPFDGDGCGEAMAEPIRLRDKKGGDFMEWPPDLQIREFPEVRHV